MQSRDYSGWVAALTLLTLAAGPHALAQPPASSPQLSFRPKLSLKWPGKPSENSQIIHGPFGDEKFYDAMYADKRPTGTIMYSAHVMEFPAKELKGASPKQLLEASVFAFKKDETSRKEISFGKKKYPGLDITSRSAKLLFSRKIVVLVGTRLYTVSVASKDEQALKAPEGKAFFESFVLDDEPLAAAVVKRQLLSCM